MLTTKRAAERSIPSLLVSTSGGCSWRTDLLQTQPFWHGWFIGLSEKFLKIKAAKLLMVAHTDRLDKSLTIARFKVCGSLFSSY